MHTEMTCTCKSMLHHDRLLFHIPTAALWAQPLKALRHPSTFLLLALPHNARDESCHLMQDKTFSMIRIPSKALEILCREEEQKTNECKCLEPHTPHVAASLCKRIEFCARHACQGIKPNDNLRMGRISAIPTKKSLYIPRVYTPWFRQ